MKPPPFDYLRAYSVEDAVHALAGTGGDGKIIAGGQSLVPLMALRIARPSLLVDINPIPGLSGLSRTGGGGARDAGGAARGRGEEVPAGGGSVQAGGGSVKIGALTRHSELARQINARLNRKA